ncbi:hypothetical protein HZA76_03105 [Candidatus Roizmanbacteria bacterium]|nr:hypothetical protein [Candidatus Roizmanbacteria bacterium]
MPTPNIKVYLAISGIIIILFLIITFVPFGKKPTINQEENNFPTPTTVETTQPQDNGLMPTVEPVDFTGVAEQEIPEETVNLSLQKQDLRGRIPLDLSTFSVDFDYGEDKFVVTLKDPKDQARSEFENWRSTNYPSLGNNQFNFR